MKIPWALESKLLVQRDLQPSKFQKCNCQHPTFQNRKKPKDTPHL